MQRIAILTLVLMLAMPIVAQEPEAKTQWVLDDVNKLLIQKFHIQMQEDYIELLKIVKAAEMRMNPGMPEEAKYNEQLQAFVIPKEKK